MLRNSEMKDRFHFDNLADLRDWLNRFNKIDLENVHPQSGEHFVLKWFEETLSDGSSVFNADIDTPDISNEEFLRRMRAAL